jgi:hypothetical protein
MKEVRMSLAKLNEAAVKTGKTIEQVAAIVAEGRIEGDWLYIPVPSLLRIYPHSKPWQHYLTPTGAVERTPRPLPPEAIEEPKLVDMAKSLGFSVFRWARAGFKLAPERVKEERRGICSVCPHWKPEGNAGLGKCVICGCSGIKWDLPDEKCPDKPERWGAVEGVSWKERLKS